MRKANSRQQKAVKIFLKEIQEPTGKTKGEILKEAGYAESVAINPPQVFGSPTVQREIESQLQAAGVTEEFVAGQLYWLMNGADKDDPNAVLGAIREYNKMKGTYAPTKTETDITKRITHTIEDDNGDYLEFLKAKQERLKAIDGEIVE